MALAGLVSTIKRNSQVGLATTQTAVIDSYDITQVRSVKWLITVSDLTSTLFQSLEVLAIHDGVNVLHSEYGVTGDDITFDVNVNIVTGNLELQVTNNSANTIQVDSVATDIHI
jgi:hypothetical protein